MALQGRYKPNPKDSHELYHFFWGLLSWAKKMEASRVGGSNAKAHVSKEFFKMLHLPVVHYPKKVTLRDVVPSEDKMVLPLHKSLQQDMKALLSTVLPATSWGAGKDITNYILQEPRLLQGNPQEFCVDDKSRVSANCCIPKQGNLPP
jgi:hypothetical protein